MKIAVLLGAIGLLECAVAQIPYTTINQTLTFTVPTLYFNLTFPVYHPGFVWDPVYQNPSLWNISFSESPDSTYVPGMMGVGEATMSSTTFKAREEPKYVNVDSKNGTYAQWPILTHEAVIAGFYLHGTTTNGNIDVLNGVFPLLDTDSVQGGDPLAASSALPYGFYELKYTAPDGLVNITGLTVTTGIVSEAPTMDEVKIKEAPFVLEDGTFNGDDFLYGRGSDWVVEPGMGGVNGQPFVPYKTIRHGPDPAGWQYQRILVPVPSNTSLFMINGTTGPGRDAMAIEYNVDPPFFDGAGGHRVNMTAKWESAGVLYWRPLDPTVLYNITLGSYLNGNFSLHSVTFYSGLWGDGASSSTSSDDKFKRRSNTGAIVGGVIGGVVGLGLLGLLSVWLYKRRSAENAEKRKWAVNPDQAVYEKPDTELDPIVLAELPRRDSAISDPLPSGAPDTTDTTDPSEHSPVSAPKGPRALPTVPQPSSAPPPVELLPPSYNPQWSSGAQRPS